ncbi:FKBP-type peptidyl-prolyl cis-trans isomerase [Nocardioides gansuensis]|uniref:FKBP-type peptidyl-prolyl cis-trans isomerase n=1 Tax=Nocardioides gansuensis TaxID=2138300 RepID=UPI001403F86A|nr:FKBP-type peptidyl-prolyl cis-trans isomerase [Nocardioides gansuensis]
MLRRTRSRATAVTGVLLLALGGLAACGDDEGAGASGAGLDSVTIEGEAGKEPKVSFDGKVAVDETEEKVVSEGDGEEVADGDSVLAHLWIGNGFTEEQAFTTWDSGKPELLTVDDQLSGAIRAGLADHTVGSRVAVAATAEDAFGEAGNPQLGIGNKDSVIFVIDLVGKISTEPSGEEKTPAKWAPTLVEQDGTITGFDFSGAHKPGGKLLETTLVKGDGPVVKKGQTIYVNYLGQVYKADKPFDDSYSKGTPASFPIGVGGVVEGWDRTLVGKTVGSRVILEIPPAMGYGEAGNKGAGIKGTDTLFFVVDILGAA